MITTKIKANEFFLVLFYFLLSFLASIKSSELFSQIDEIESEYKSLSLKILAQYSKRCSVSCVPSYHSCGLSFPNLTCNYDMNISTCNCAYLNKSLGTYLNISTSTVSLTVSLKNFMSDKKKYQDMAELVCSTEFLKDEFSKLKKKFGIAKWQYFGGYNGIMRLFPANEMCADFDPRIRPWYLTATTDFKKIILMVDLSQSMNYKGKIDMLKSVMKEMVSSLSIYDWIGIVGYNTNASAFDDKLVRMSQKNKKNVSNYIDTLKAEGLSNYEKAFDKAFNIINFSTKDNNSNFSCKNFLLFFSDGKPTSGETDPTKLVKLIKRLQNETNELVIISTFNIMKPKAYDILHQLSCAGMGFYYNISKPLDFQKNVIKFFSDIANQSMKTGPIWSEPYFDTLGLGWITSLTFPLYHEKALIGVLGADFQMEALYSNYSIQDENGWSEKYLLNRSQKKPENCTREKQYFNDSCFLNFFRKDKCNYLLDQQVCTNKEQIDGWHLEKCDENFTSNQVFFGNNQKKKENFPSCCDPCPVIIKQDYTYLYYIGVAVGVLGCTFSILILRWIRKKRFLRSTKRKRTFLKSVYKTM